MNPFHEDFNKIIFALQSAISAIESVTNPDISLLTTRIKSDLVRHVDALKIQNGIEPANAPVAENKPLTHVFGKRVLTEDGAPIGEGQPKLLTARDVELAELKEKTNIAYESFIDTPSDQILDTLNDLEIRAVAKKAGLPVSENHPKRIDATFVEQIKNAIEKQKETVTQVGAGDQLGDTSLPWLNDGANEGIGEPDAKVYDEEFIEEFGKMTNVSILEAYTEQELKDFATQSGVEVDDDTKIDSKFVTSIKTAIGVKK